MHITSSKIFTVTNLEVLKEQIWHHKLTQACPPLYLNFMYINDGEHYLYLQEHVVDETFFLWLEKQKEE